MENGKTCQCHMLKWTSVPSTMMILMLLYHQKVSLSINAIALELSARFTGSSSGWTISSRKPNWSMKLEEGFCDSWFSTPGLVRLFTYWASAASSIRQCFYLEELLHSIPLMALVFSPPSFCDILSLRVSDKNSYVRHSNSDLFLRTMSVIGSFWSTPSNVKIKFSFRTSSKWQQ